MTMKLFNYRIYGYDQFGYCCFDRYCKFFIYNGSDIIVIDGERIELNGLRIEIDTIE